MATTVTTAPAAAPATTAAPVVGTVAATAATPRVGLRGSLLLLAAIYAAAVCPSHDCCDWWPAGGRPPASR